MSLFIKRLFQDDKGSISIIVNKKIERLICIDEKNQNENILETILIWLKLQNEKCWHRFFIDAGCCFCDLYNSNYEIDTENIECPIYDLSDRVKALTINYAIVYPTNDSGVRLEITLENKSQIIFGAEDIESESSLSIVSTPI